MKLEIFMEQEKCSNAAPQNGGFALSISRAVFLRKQGSFIRHLMREIEYQTLSQRVFFFFSRRKRRPTEPSTHSGEAQVRINGAHIKETNKNTLTRHCCMNSFISGCVGKHNSKALALKMPFSLITSAEH